MVLMESSALNPADVTLLLQRIRGEFLEMPGLCLTERQAQRLWTLEPARCRLLLDALVESGFLARTANGTFVRAGSVSRHSADLRLRGRTPAA